MKYYIPLIVIVAIILGAIALVSRPAPNAVLPPEGGPVETSLPTASQSPVVVEEDDAPVPDEFSLPAFFEKEFDGRDLQLGQVLADNESYTRHYITYRSGDLTISGIMNVPKGAGPFPVIIANHGYIDPAIYTNGRGLKREQDYLARAGYVVLHPDYRNYADSSDDAGNDVRFRLGYVEDVINAVYAIKNSDIDSIDKNKIGMLGHSMGGGVTTNVIAIQPELVQAAVLFAPVSANQENNFERWLSRRPEVANEILRLFGPPTKDSEFWRNISVSNFLDRITAPVMIHHGTSDASVPLEWSQELAQQMQGADKDITLHVYPGEPHEFTDAWPTVMQRTVEFFDQHVKTAS